MKAKINKTIIAAIKNNMLQGNFMDQTIRLQMESNGKGGSEKLDASVARSLGEALVLNTTIESLSLSGVRFFSDEAARHLANAMKANKAIKHLSLVGCNLSPKALGYFAEALKENYTLESLDLSKNTVNAKTAMEFATILENNSSLKSLILKDSGLSNTAALFLVDGLACNSNLQLNLQGNSAISLELDPLFAKINAKGTRVLHNPNLSAAPTLLSVKEEAQLYIANYVQTILSEERSRLLTETDASDPRGAIVTDLIKNLNQDTRDFINEEAITPAEYKEGMKAKIQGSLNQEGLDQYPGWGAKLGLVLLNILIMLPIVPAVLKRLTTGSWTLSLNGQSYDKTNESLASVEQLPTPIPAAAA